MLSVEFDETLESVLSPEELWALIAESFEDPASSPLWPSGAEKIDVEALEPGAEVRACYHLGPLSAKAKYRITAVEEGASFSYETLRSHPLTGGATLSVEPRDDGTSALHWVGAYRPQYLPTGLPAYLFVRVYFLRSFFRRLRANLKAYEKQVRGEATEEEPGRAEIAGRHSSPRRSTVP